MVKVGVRVKGRVMDRFRVVCCRQALLHKPNAPSTPGKTYRGAWVVRAALVAKMRAAGVEELSVSGAKVRDFVSMFPDQKGQLLEMAGGAACRKSGAKLMTALLEESGLFFGVAPCNRKTRRYSQSSRVVSVF